MRLPALIPAATLFALLLGFGLPVHAAIGSDDATQVTAADDIGAKTKKTKFPY